MFKRSTLLLLVTAVVTLVATGCPQPPPPVPPVPPVPGNIAGTITDANTGVVIPGATVNLQGPGGTFEAITAPNGSYAFGGILAGNYTVVAHADGYNATSRAVTVSANSTANGDVGLVRNPTRRFHPFLASCNTGLGREQRGGGGGPTPGTLVTLADIQAAINAGALQLRALLEEELEGLTTDPDTVDTTPADTTDRTSIDEPGRQNLAFSVVSIWFNQSGALADVSRFLDDDMRIPRRSDVANLIECRVAGIEVHWQVLTESDSFDPCQNDPLFFAANRSFCLGQPDRGVSRGFGVPIGGVIAASDDPGLDPFGLPPAPGSRVVVDNTFAITLTNDADDRAGNAPFPLSNTTNNTTIASQNENGVSWISITNPDPTFVVVVVSWHFPDPQLGQIELGPKKKLVKRFLKVPQLRIDKFDEDNILATARNQNEMCETVAVGGVIWQNECQVVIEGTSGDAFMRIRVSNVGREPVFGVELTDIMREAGFEVGADDPSYGALAGDEPYNANPMTNFSDLDTGVPDGVTSDGNLVFFNNPGGNPLAQGPTGLSPDPLSAAEGDDENIPTITAGTPEAGFVKDSAPAADSGAATASGFLPFLGAVDDPSIPAGASRIPFRSTTLPAKHFFEVELLGSCGQLDNQGNLTVGLPVPGPGGQSFSGAITGPTMLINQASVAADTFFVNIGGFPLFPLSLTIPRADFIKIVCRPVVNIDLIGFNTPGLDPEQDDPVDPFDQADSPFIIEVFPTPGPASNIPIGSAAILGVQFENAVGSTDPTITNVVRIGVVTEGLNLEDTDASTNGGPALSDSPIYVNTDIDGSQFAPDVACRNITAAVGGPAGVEAALTAFDPTDTTAFDASGPNLPISITGPPVGSPFYFVGAFATISSPFALECRFSLVGDADDPLDGSFSPGTALLNPPNSGLPGDAIRVELLLTARSSGDKQTIAHFDTANVPSGKLDVDTSFLVNPPRTD